MITNCQECGKTVVAHWPEFWPYRRGDIFYCSYNCYDVALVRDTKTMNDVLRKRRQAKMERLKKDGTPAKKPGPKKAEIPEGNMTVVATKAPPQVPTVKLDGALRIETPEAGKVEVISKECIGVKPIENGLEFEYRVTGIDTAVGSFIYSKKQGYVDWDPIDGSGTVSMNLEEWKEFMKVFPGAMKVLGVKL